MSIDVGDSDGGRVARRNRHLEGLVVAPLDVAVLHGGVAARRKVALSHVGRTALAVEAAAARLAEVSHGERVVVAVDGARVHVGVDLRAEGVARHLVAAAGEDLEAIAEVVDRVHAVTAAAVADALEDLLGDRVGVGVSRLAEEHQRRVRDGVGAVVDARLVALGVAEHGRRERDGGLRRRKSHQSHQQHDGQRGRRGRHLHHVERVERGETARHTCARGEARRWRWHDTTRKHGTRRGREAREEERGRQTSRGAETSGTSWWRRQLGRKAAAGSARSLRAPIITEEP